MALRSPSPSTSRTKRHHLSVAVNPPLLHGHSSYSAPRTGQRSWQLSAMLPSSIYASILGALVGDAAGAVLEFCREPITEKLVRHAMSMPGGGSLNVAPGQITDDGELTLALASVLRSLQPQDDFPADAVASVYSDWYHSPPFDIGNTCSQAFSSVPRWKTVNASQTMSERAAEVNMGSLGNGSLMRSTPIGVFLRNSTHDKIAEAARADAQLSHPNMSCQDAGALYCLAIAHLTNHPGDRQGATDLVDHWPITSAEVKSWLDDSKVDNTLENLNCRFQMGNVKYGFTLAMYFLRRAYSYEDAIFATLMKGGDTDTNACIVGGLIGALHGIQGIPQWMLEPVLSFHPELHDSRTAGCGYARPAMYRAGIIRDGWDGGSGAR